MIFACRKYLCRFIVGYEYDGTGFRTKRRRGGGGARFDRRKKKEESIAAYPNVICMLCVGG